MGARLLRLPRLHDARGSLSPIEFGPLPFTPCRMFAIHGVPAGTVRGAHAHRSAWQLLVCLNGRVDIELREAGSTAAVVLDHAEIALLIEPGVWASQTYVAEGSILAVLSSEAFDESSYVADAHIHAAREHDRSD